MKLLNKITAFSLAGVLCLAAAGCSGGTGGTTKLEVTDSSVSQVVADAKAKLEEESESKAVITVDFNLKANDESSSAVSVTEVKARKNPELISIKTGGTQDGNAVEDNLEVYLEQTEESYYIYMPYNGEWYKQDMDGDYIKTLFKQYYVAENIGSIIDNVDNIKLAGEEKVGDTDTFKITCEIPADKTYEVAEGTSVFFNIGLSGIQKEIFDVKDPVPVTLWINAADGTVVKVYMDYTKALQDIINAVYASYGAELGEDTGRLGTDKYLVTIEMSDYGNLKDFAIPEDIKNAKDFGESGDVTVLDE